MCTKLQIKFHFPLTEAEKIAGRKRFTRGRDVFTRGRDVFLSRREIFLSRREIFTGGLIRNLSRARAMERQKEKDAAHVTHPTPKVRSDMCGMGGMFFAYTIHY
jgi:hypothetical protein